MSTLEWNPIDCVVGIDSALSKTGIAIVEYDGHRCRAFTFLVSTGPTDTNSHSDRYRRIKAAVRGTALFLPQTAALALMEGPAFDADYGNAWDRAAVHWWIANELYDRGIPIAEVTPATLKYWVAKHGRAKKRLIVTAMHAMWPGVSCTINEQRHHECEGLGMATMCAQHMGWPVPVRAHQGRSLAVVKWPTPAAAA